MGLSLWGKGGFLRAFCHTCPCFDVLVLALIACLNREGFWPSCMVRICAFGTNLPDLFYDVWLCLFLRPSVAVLEGGGRYGRSCKMCLE